jgi:hypothetical protein
MNIDIYIDETKLNLSDVSLTDYKQQMIDKKEELANVEIPVPQFNLLKGNKELLHKAFLNQMVESLNV